MDRGLEILEEFLQNRGILFVRSDKLGLFDTVNVGAWRIAVFGYYYGVFRMIDDSLEQYEILLSDPDCFDNIQRVISK